MDEKLTKEDITCAFHGDLEKKVNKILYLTILILLTTAPDVIINLVSKVF